MPRQPGQKLKLLYLMKILLEKTDEQHPMKRSELQEALHAYGIEAERKSLYDDIRALRDYGLDVVSTSGRESGYYIGERAFQLPELRLLVDAVQSSRFLTYKKSNELIRKVEGLCSTHEAKLLQRQVFVDHRVKTGNEYIYYNVDTIHAAVIAGKQIRFRYFQWAVCFTGHEKYRKEYRHGGEEYCISPWALSWDDDNYYMIGYDAEAARIKHYRVDKMEQISITELPCEGQSNFKAFDTAVYSQKLFSMFGGTEEPVALRFDNSLIGVVLDRFGKEVFLRKEDDGHFVIRTSVQVSPQFFSWVFGLGEKVRILSPAHVVEAFLTQMRSIGEQYGE